jgi:hypothetical protein
MCVSDVHFRDVSTKLAMDARAIDAVSDECLHVRSKISCNTHHIKMPRL